MGPWFGEAKEWETEALDMTRRLEWDVPRCSTTRLPGLQRAAELVREVKRQ